jgi:hypothetical protein
MRHDEIAVCLDSTVALFDADGNAAVTDTSGGITSLRQAAREAISQWQFEKGDKGRRTTVVIIYKQEGEAVPRQLKQQPKVTLWPPDRVEVSMHPATMDDAYPSIPRKRH